MTSVLISAGDASGDGHAADLLRALEVRRPTVRAFGLGGPALRAAGLEPVVDQRDLAVGGLLELAGSARRLAAAWRGLGRALAERRPALAVLVDSGGFNLPLARRIRRVSPATRILYYVAPQVWAWRSGRIRKLAARTDRIAVILPFERGVYARGGVDVDFVGHPSVDRLEEVRRTLDRKSARDRLRLDPDAPLVALMPGSRRNEVARQLPVQLEAARHLHRREPRLAFVLGLAPSIDAGQVEALVAAAGLPRALRLQTVVGETPAALRASDVVLAKPGTVTVEAMLLERPMVVMGRANPITAAILQRAVHVRWLAMPNLIADALIVPELLQGDATPEALADALYALLGGPAREAQLARLAVAREALGGGGAAERAADIAEALLDAAPA